ncbi:MAG: YdcF family protein, partial [Longimicrobiales bacterium]
MSVLRGLRRLLIAVAVLWTTALLAVLAAGAWPQLRRADAILVLGAAQYNGRPSPVLKARLDHALDLYQRGYAERLIFTGGVGQGDTLSEGEVSRRYAVDAGVPDSVILVERQGATSAESMGYAAALMRAND